MSEIKSIWYGHCQTYLIFLKLEGDKITALEAVEYMHRASDVLDKCLYDDPVRQAGASLLPGKVVQFFDYLMLSQELPDWCELSEATK